VGLTLVGVLVSFGPRLELGEGLRLRPLYHQLYELVPGFDALRVPGRFGVLVTTGLAVLAGFAAAALARRLPDTRWRGVALIALGGFAVLEVWAVPLKLRTVPLSPGPADRWLATRPGAEAVLVLPMYEPRVSHLESLRLLGSTAHWRPLVNGYAGELPPDYVADVAVLNTFPAPAAVARLRAIHVRYAVVHLGQYPAEPRARLAAALARPPPGVTRVATFPHTEIFEIGPEDVQGSGETGRVDERPGARESRRLDEAAGRLERVEALGDREHRVEAIAPRLEPLSRALLAVDQDDEVLDHESRGFERLDRLELGRPVGDDVVDHDDALARLERAFDALARAVRLRLTPRIDEGHAPGQAGGDGEGQSRVRDPCDPVGPAASHLGRHEAPDLHEHVGVRDHDPQVEVEGGRGPGLQDELAEAHAPDRVEPAHEQPGVRRAHAGISARMAAAAPTGSAAPVIGRPTTR
jgi:hypothetical protein